MSDRPSIHDGWTPEPQEEVQPGDPWRDPNDPIGDEPYFGPEGTGHQAWDEARRSHPMTSDPTPHPIQTETVMGTLRDAAEQAHGFMHYGPFSECEAAICVRRFAVSRTALSTTPAPLDAAFAKALTDVLAHRAAPPEYPGLALVPVDLLNRLERLAVARRVSLHKPHDQKGGPVEGFPTCSMCGAIQTLAALSTTPAPLDVDRIADDVRYVDGNGTSDYWRGFNDGIDKLAEAIAREYAKP